MQNSTKDCPSWLRKDSEVLDPANLGGDAPMGSGGVLTVRNKAGREGGGGRASGRGARGRYDWDTAPRGATSPASCILPLLSSRAPGRPPDAPEVWDRVALGLAQKGDGRAGGLREHGVLGRGGHVGRRAAHGLCKGARRVHYFGRLT